MRNRHLAHDEEDEGGLVFGGGARDAAERDLNVLRAPRVDKRRLLHWHCGG